MSFYFKKGSELDCTNVRSILSCFPGSPHNTLGLMLFNEESSIAHDGAVNPSVGIAPSSRPRRPKAVFLGENDMVLFCIQTLELSG